MKTTFNLTKNIIVFYHENCIDGFASAYVAWKKFKNKAEYISLSHNKIENSYLKNKGIIYKKLKDKKLYFIDFCPEFTELENIKKFTNEIVILDHHISRKKEVLSMEKTGSVFGENISGSYIASQYFFPKDKIPKLIRYISIGDTFTWGKEKYEQEIHSYISSLEFEFKTFQKAEKELENKNKFLEILKIGNLLNKNFNKLVDANLPNAKIVNFGNYNVYVVNSFYVFATNIGAKLNTEKNIDFVMIYSFTKDSLKVSLRGKDKVDLSKFAEKYGGGGHFNAAAFSSNDPKFIEEFIKKIIG
jgi:nanoRNase/pAp phosphatase (c-di-AMP/oligoRNAs hydrolase)